MRQISEKVMISLHTFENSAFGASDFDIPIKDQKWSGRFVKRIRGSDRGSSIGIVDFSFAHSTHTHTPHLPLSHRDGSQHAIGLCGLCLERWFVTRSFHLEGGRRIEDAIRRSTAAPQMSLATGLMTAGKCGQQWRRRSATSAPSLTMNEFIPK